MGVAEFASIQKPIRVEGQRPYCIKEFGDTSPASHLSEFGGGYEPSQKCVQDRCFALRRNVQFPNAVLQSNGCIA